MFRTEKKLKKSLDLFIFFVVKNNIIHHTHRAKKKEVTCACNKHVVIICADVDISFSDHQYSFITDEWGYQDAFKLINTEKKNEQVVTCDYGTRIDYIYVHPRVND